MSAEKFTSRPVPSQASPALREYLEDQISRLQLLANGAALREEEETITGDWTFDGSVVFNGRLQTPDDFVLGTVGNAPRDDNDNLVRLYRAGVGSVGLSTGDLVLQGRSDGGDAGVAMVVGDPPTVVLRARADFFSVFNTIVARDGSAIAPSIRFSGDSDAGFFLRTGVVGIAMAGLEVGTFAQSGIHALNGGSIYVEEKAAANTDIAGRGQLWVKNTSPCQLWFTDDAGTDHQIV